MKKFLCILLALALTLGASGCALLEKAGDKAEEAVEAVKEGVSEIAQSEPVQQAAESVQGAAESLGESELLGKLKDGLQEFLPERLEHLRGVALMYKDTDLSALSGTYGHMLEAGFEAGAAPEETLEAGGVSGDITARYQEAEFIVRLANPAEKSAEYRECIICYVRVSSEQVSVVGGLSCGSSTVEDVVSYFGTPYRRTDDTLTYKITLPQGFDVSSVSALIDSLKNLKNAEHHIVFEFSGGVLSAICLQTPQFLYSGLQENVAPEDLEALDQLSTAERERMIRVRDDILDELLEEFREEGIDATIDRDTGKLTLDNNILFEQDSYALSDEGRRYLDRVSEAYADVLLDDDYEHALGSILFEGHTNTDGTYEYNLTLSENRANAVMDSFVNGRNDLSDRERTRLASLTKAEGFSFSDPIFAEDGSVDMVASRRVEIKFYLNVR